MLSLKRGNTTASPCHRFVIGTIEIAELVRAKHQWLYETIILLKDFKRGSRQAEQKVAEHDDGVNFNCTL